MPVFIVDNCSHKGFRKKTSPLIGWTCAIDAKNRVFFGWLKFVNAYVKRGKKNFEKRDFWFQVYARLIEKRLDPSYLWHRLRLAGTGCERVCEGLVLLTNRKDYELFNKIWGESVGP